jgi:hypothetical protein
MLLFDDSKALEKALGTEAATVIVRVFEKLDEQQRRELVTKADLELHLSETEARLKAEIHASRAETIKVVAGLLVVQAAAITALIKIIS